jgi:hypothetical protein
MQKRGILFVIALLVAGLSAPAGFAAPAKEETVTLTITGMT